MPATVSRISPAQRKGELHVGFVPVIDAAPLIAAAELGYFTEEGLRVCLDRQIGWGNVRDKLTFGQLQASQALLGMPVLSQIGADHFIEPLISISALGSGGNAITLSHRITSAGVNSAASLARWLSQTINVGEPVRPVFAHVFGCSTHHYLLREWLAGGGADPDEDVRLGVLPPSQMPEKMGQGNLDGFCVSEPWNTIAARAGWGSIVAFTTDVLPAHPEKVLAVTRRWYEQNPGPARGLVRAALRGCAYCQNHAHLDALAEMLALPKYFGLPTAMLRESLRLTSSPAAKANMSANPMRSFAPSATFPSATHAAWLIEQMIRWGHLSPDLDVLGIARSCTETAAYREAAASLHIECPVEDLPPLPLRHGLWYEPTSSV